jgi:hypothetical protein
MAKIWAHDPDDFMLLYKPRNGEDRNAFAPTDDPKAAMICCDVMIIKHSD